MSTTLENRELNADRWRDIVDAAGAEFREVGYAGARLQDIARRAGLTAGSLYHYIGSKEDLLYELVSMAYARSLAAATNLRDRPDEDAAERLRALIIGWCEFVRELPFTVEDRDNQFLTAEHRAELDDQRRQIVTIPRAIIDRGIEQGRFDPDLDSAVVATSLFSLLNAPRKWYGPDLAVVPLPRVYEWFADAFIGAMTSSAT